MNIRLFLPFVFFTMTLVHGSDRRIRCRWEAFKRQYGKRYRSTVEEEKRLNIFRQNIEKLLNRPQNAGLNIHHIRGVNEYSDMTAAEEKKRKAEIESLRNNPVPVTARDMEEEAPEQPIKDPMRVREKIRELREQFIQNPDAPSNILRPHLDDPWSIQTSRPAEFPQDMKDVDWRYCFATDKHRRVCGSRFPCAAVALMECYNYIITGNFTELSEQEIFDCSVGERKRWFPGYLANVAFEYVIRNGGIHSERIYPFTGLVSVCAYDPSVLQRGASHSVKDSASSSLMAASFQRIITDIPPAEVSGQMKLAEQQCESNSSDRHFPLMGYNKVDNSEEELERVVREVGPVVVSMDLQNDLFRHQKAGIYNNFSCNTNAPNIELVVVGFGKSKYGDDYWILRNSWGTTWGEDGYFKMARNKNNMCGIASRAFYPDVDPLNSKYTKGNNKKSSRAH